GLETWYGAHRGVESYGVAQPGHSAGRARGRASLLAIERRLDLAGVGGQYPRGLARRHTVSSEPRLETSTPGLVHEHERAGQMPGRYLRFDIGLELGPTGVVIVRAHLHARDAGGPEPRDAEAQGNDHQRGTAQGAGRQLLGEQAGRPRGQDHERRNGGVEEPRTGKEAVGR